MWTKSAQTLCLTLCVALWSVSASATPASLSIEHVHAGWRAPADGYFLDELSGLEIVQSWSETERDLLAYRDGYMALQQEIDRAAREHESAVKGLQDALKAERKAARAQAQRSTGRGIMLGLILGVIIGLNR